MLKSKGLYYILVGPITKTYRAKNWRGHLVVHKHESYRFCENFIVWHQGKFYLRICYDICVELLLTKYMEIYSTFLLKFKVKSIVFKTGAKIRDHQNLVRLPYLCLSTNMSWSDEMSSVFQCDQRF